MEAEKAVSMLVVESFPVAEVAVQVEERALLAEGVRGVVDPLEGFQQQLVPTKNTIGLSGIVQYPHITFQK